MTYQYLVDTGVVVADTSTLKTDIQTEYRDSLGTDLILDDATPQGRLIDSETTARSNVINNNAQLANQINPNLAKGVYLWSISALMGIGPGKNSPSFLGGVVLSGVAGSIVPALSKARTSTGLTFQSVSTVTLNGSGTATVDFQCLENGPNPVETGALNTVVDRVSGWTGVNNPTAAVLGTTKLTDAQLRLFRKESLAKQGSGSTAAVKAGLLALPGVKSISIRDNPDSVPATIDGLAMPKNSLWVCVDGGLDVDIATALLAAKSAGGGWTFADNPAVGKRVTVNVVDPSSGQTYAVKFSRPDEIKTAAHFQVRSSTSIQEPQQAVVDAVLRYVNGLLPDERGLVIGASVSPFELAGAVTAQIPGMYVKWVGVWVPPAVNPGPPNASDIAVQVWQKATLVAADIRVEVL